MNKYDSWHQAHAADDDVEAVWHAFVKNELREEDVNGKILLEIGCGRGGFSQHLARKYPGMETLFSCDYSDAALDICRAKYPELKGIRWQKEDIQRLSFGASSFDTVISCETIEHVPEPRNALGELFRVLKPGGRLILTCPNYFNFFGLWCLYRKAIGKPFTEGGQPYVRYLLAPGVYARLRLLGFTVEHFHTSELVLPARFPKTFYPMRVPGWLSFFGNRSFFTLTKKFR